MSIRSVIGIATIAILLFAAACGAGNPQQDARLPEIPGNPQLPRPASLEERSTSAAFPWFSLASDFVPGQTKRTLPGFSFGQRIFQPDYETDGSGAGPAWAMHAIDVTGFAGDEELHLDWEDAPASGSLFVGIANFASGRWEWTAPADPGLLNFSVDADHTSPTDIFYVAVLMTGTDEAILNWLRLGGNIPPVVSLSATVPGGFDSLVTDLVATAEDPEGSPITFEFDIEGDGSFIASGSSTLVDVLYSSPGAYHAAVRVTDGNGGVTVASTLVGVGWIHSYGGTGFDAANDLAVGPLNSAVMTGNANSFGAGGDEPFLLEFSDDGVPGPEWSVGTSNGDEGYSITSNPDGAILVTGSVFNGDDSDTFAFMISDIGVLAWQKTWGSADDDEQSSGFIADSGSSIIASEYGDVDKFTILLTEFSADGSVVSQKKVSTGTDVGDPRLAAHPEGGFYLVCLVRKDPGPGQDPVVIRFDSDMNQVWAKRLQVVDFFELGKCFASGDDLYFCGGLNIEESGDIGSCFFKVGEDGGIQMQKRLEMGGINAWYDVTVDPSTGDVLLCGGIRNQGGGDGTLCGSIARYSPLGVLEHISAWNQPLFNNDFSSIKPHPDGGFYVAGRTEDNTGDWYEPTYTEHDDSFDWVEFSPDLASASVAPSDFTATKADITTAVLDTGGGGSADVVIMRWYEP